LELGGDDPAFPPVGKAKPSFVRVKDMFERWGTRDSTAAARAREAHRRLFPVDRL
jgi:hypothetical protein